MAINLAAKYEKKLDERFKLGSLTDAYAGKQYEFNGVNAINIWTTDKVGINDYTRNGMSRFGTVKELGDTLQTLVMTQDRGYTFSVDAGNAGEQFNIKQVNSKLKEVWDEEATPEIDMYRFRAWANGAGVSMMNATALTEETIIKVLLTGHKELSNRRVPKGKARVTFISESLAIEFQLNQKLGNNESFTTKAIINGQLGVMNGSPVVAVPDDLFPKGVLFIIKYKNATVDPMKRKVLRLHKNPPGLDGDLGEGRFIHDSFVLDQKANGIYVYGKSDMATMPTVSVASGTVTITAGTGETIAYTTDGTNPKTSKTAQTYNGSSKPVIEAGQTVKAYAYKSGALNSGIAEAAYA